MKKLRKTRKKGRDISPRCPRPRPAGGNRRYAADENPRCFRAFSAGTARRAIPTKKLDAFALPRAVREWRGSFTATLTSMCMDSSFRCNTLLRTRSYFCDPYASWQKATVENTIGLIRRCWPKGSAFHLLARQEVKGMEKKLNHRPRKCLQFRTPKEVFSKQSIALHC